MSEGSHPAAVQGEAVPFWVDEDSEDGGLELEDVVEGSEDEEVETETKTEDRGWDRMSGELWEVPSREFLCIHSFSDIKKPRKKHRLKNVSAPAAKKAKVCRSISGDF